MDREEIFRIKYLLYEALIVRKVAGIIAVANEKELYYSGIVLREEMQGMLDFVY